LLIFVCYNYYMQDIKKIAYIISSGMLAVFLFIYWFYCGVIGDTDLLSPVKIKRLDIVEDKLNEYKNQENFLPLTREESVKLLFFGDMMLGRHVEEKIEQHGIDYIFQKIASGTENIFFDNYDLISANLEGAVTNEGNHYAPIMEYDFAFSPPVIKELKRFNFSSFNIANNHLADQGERGIIETRKNLVNLGYFYIGCQDGMIAACSASTTVIKGKKIGLAGFSMVYSKLDEDRLATTVSELASSTDLVMVNIHWGIEYEHFYNPLQKKTAHSLIDSGADIIIGHHPHVVQGIEIYQGRPIFYSLGNFIFDQYFSAETQEGLALGIEITQNNYEINLLPFKSKLSQVEWMNEKENERFINNFISWSAVDEKIKTQIKQGIILLNYDE